MTFDTGERMVFGPPGSVTEVEMTDEAVKADGPYYGTFRVDPDGTLTALPELRVEDIAEATGINVEAFMARLERFALEPVEPMVAGVCALTDPIWDLKERTVGALDRLAEDAIIEFELGLEKGWRWIDRWFSG